MKNNRQCPRLNRYSVWDRVWEILMSVHDDYMAVCTYLSTIGVGERRLDVIYDDTTPADVIIRDYLTRDK